MPVLITGINHKTADLNLREQVAFVVDELPAALQDAHHSIEGLAGVVILSTCNRTEIIGSGDSLEDHSLIHWLAENRKMSAAALLGHLYSYRGTEAMEHLARVACGMDSMVFGEPQILGQVKESFDIARQHEYINPELGRLFPHVFHIAKRVRTETGIGTSSVSLASAILVLARQLFSDLDELEALLIGAGEMMEPGIPSPPGPGAASRRICQPHAGTRQKAGIKRRGQLSRNPGRDTTLPISSRYRGVWDRQSADNY